MFISEIDFESPDAEIYFKDLDICSKLVNSIESDDVGDPVIFHFYWKELRSNFNYKNYYSLISFLATQDKRHKCYLWSDKPFNDNPLIDDLIEKCFFEFHIYDPEKESLGTCLEGSDEIINAKDDLCWIDGDVCRLLLLNNYGGVWVDMDILLLRDLSPLLCFEFVYAWGSKEKLCNGAIMRFKRHSEAIQTLLQTLKDTECKPQTTNWGCGIYDKAREKEFFHRFPCGFFNPELLYWDVEETERIEKPDYFFIKNEKSEIIYDSFAWHWHNKWNAEIERGSKFDILVKRMLKKL